MSTYPDSIDQLLWKHIEKFHPIAALASIVTNSRLVRRENLILLERRLRNLLTRAHCFAFDSNIV